MKIGFFIGYLKSKEENIGGPWSYTVNLVRHLIKFKNLEIYLISHKRGSHPIYDETKTILLPNLPFVNLIELKNLNLDIIHFNYIPLTFRKISIFLFLKNVKKVVTIHGDEIYTIPELYDYGPPFLKWYCPFIEPRICKKTDALLPVSQNLCSRLLEHWKVSETKFHTVYNGIDHDTFKPIKNAHTKIREKYGLDNEFILHISNFSIKKNPKTLIKTFEKLVTEENINMDLVIVGGRWKENINRFLLDISPSVKQKIKLIGSVPLSDLPIFYSAAQLFFFPTYHETFGFPNVEAMACGTPVISSNVYSVPEITGNAALLCDPEDISGFMATIKTVLEDNNLRKNMIRAGLKNAKRFTWENSAKEVAMIYNQIIKNS